MKIKFVMARSIIGFAIGDALGVPYEFKKRGTFHCTGLRASGMLDAHLMLPLGSWSDDTSLLLCVLDSLREPVWADIYKRWRRNAIAWRWFGKFTNHGYRIPYDIGRSCRIGIDCMTFHRPSIKASDVSSNGNGGLMRILPLAFVPFSCNEELWDGIRTFNSCSHDHKISNVCCLLYIRLAKKLLEGIPFEAALKETVDAIEDKYKIPELCRIWNLSILDAPMDDIRSTGYVVDTLEAAIWCCQQGNNFRETVLKAVNLGYDTDTVAAITGGLAGIIYDDLPDEWVSNLRRLHVIQKACNILGVISEKKYA